MGVSDEAVVKVRIDTSEAQAQLDTRTRDRREKKRRRRDDDSRDDKKDRRQRRQRRPGGTAKIAGTTALAQRRGGLGKLGLIGLAVAASTYGPAFIRSQRAMIAEAQKDASLIVKVALEAQDIRLAFLEKVVDGMSEAIAWLVKSGEAAFGAVRDTTEIAKLQLLWGTDIDPAFIADFATFRFQSFKAQGLGKWAGRELIRRELGTNFGTQLMKQLKTQE